MDKAEAKKHLDTLAQAIQVLTKPPEPKSTGKKIHCDAKLHERLRRIDWSK